MKFRSLRAAQEPVTVPVFDLELLRETAHGSTVFMNRILTSFHTNTPASLTEFRTALAAADWPATAALAHKLRPSLRLLGAAATTPLLETVEDKTAPEAARRKATEKLVAALEKLLEGLPQKVD